jgi:hypothetical protein
MTRQLSSGWTLAIRIFFPTLWIAFFGSFLLAVWFSNSNTIGAIPVNGLRIGVTLFFALFLFIFYKTIFRLKRVDADSEYVYITNYLKTVRYKHEFVKGIKLSKGILFNYATLELTGKATFGDRILFLLSKKRLDIFLNENPQLRGWVLNE